eukprot:546617-Pelagomonas_calceolata.AAC.6
MSQSPWCSADKAWAGECFTAGEGMMSILARTVLSVSTCPGCVGCIPCCQLLFRQLAHRGDVDGGLRTHGDERDGLRQREEIQPRSFGGMSRKQMVVYPQIGSSNERAFSKGALLACMGCEQQSAAGKVMQAFWSDGLSRQYATCALKFRMQLDAHKTGSHCIKARSLVEVDFTGRMQSFPTNLGCDSKNQQRPTKQGATVPKPTVYRSSGLSRQDTTEENHKEMDHKQQTMHRGVS